MTGKRVTLGDVLLGAPAAYAEAQRQADERRAEELELARLREREAQRRGDAADAALVAAVIAGPAIARLRKPVVPPSKRRGPGRPSWTPGLFRQHDAEARAAVAPADTDSAIATHFRALDGNVGTEPASYARLRRRFAGTE